MVVRAVEPHITVEPLTKLEPATVRVKAAPPARAVEGVKDVIFGAPMVNVDAEEDAVLVFFTVTAALPAEASWVVVTAAVREVALP